MARIALLHPGEMGAAVGAALVSSGHTVGWLPSGRSAATAARARAAGLVDWTEAAARDADVVVSVVPPAAALDTAASLRAFGGLYLDANAVSPQRAAEVARVVAAAGAAYVDGGIVGPPPHAAGTTRLFLSGSGAPEVADLFAGSVVEPVVVGEGFEASALKMTYAAMTKIGAALALAARDAATAYGVLDALREEWSRSQPGLLDRLARAEADATAKGWRWSAEMRQIAETFAAADVPEGFGEAAATVFERYPRPR